MKSISDSLTEIFIIFDELNTDFIQNNSGGETNYLPFVEGFKEKIAQYDSQFENKSQIFKESLETITVLVDCLKIFRNDFPDIYKCHAIKKLIINILMNLNEIKDKSEEASIFFSNVLIF